MEFLRSERSALIASFRQTKNSYANRLSFQSQLLKFEEKRVRLWHLGMLDNPLLAMNSETFPVHLPDVCAEKTKKVINSLSKLRVATDRYLSMLDRQSIRLRRQSERLAASNRFSRFFMLPWFAIRNWFSLIKRERADLEVEEKNFVMAVFTQLLRYCDWKINAGYARMQLKPQPGETEEDLKKRVQLQYKKLRPHIHAAEQEEFDQTSEYLMKSESKRMRGDKKEWKETKSLEMAWDLIMKMHWEVPVQFRYLLPA
jgi:hypothetical protein